MKRNFHPELLYALESAAINGDKVAKFVWEQIQREDHDAVFRGHRDNFRFIKHASYDRQLEIACTSKDVSNENVKALIAQDPDWLYKMGKYDVVSLASFLRFFQERDKLKVVGNDIERFGDALKVGSPLKAKLSDDFYDFQYAYLGLNYAQIRRSEFNTLGHSCMRKISLKRILPEWYKYVCNCKILLVTNVMEQVVGRALVYPHACLNQEEDVCVMSRAYYMNLGVRDFIFRKAEELGVDVRLHMDDDRDWHCIPVCHSVYDQDDFELSIQLHANPLYKGGCSYLDCMFYIRLGDDGNLYASNKSCSEFAEGMDTYLGSCDNTDGTFDGHRSICPYCGELIENARSWLCDNCAEELNCNSIFDQYPVLKTREIRGYGAVPEAFIDADGELIPSAASALLLNKITGKTPRKRDTDEEGSDCEQMDNEEDD